MVVTDQIVVRRPRPPAPKPEALEKLKKRQRKETPAPPPTPSSLAARSQPEEVPETSEAATRCPYYKNITSKVVCVCVCVCVCVNFVKIIFLNLRTKRSVMKKLRDGVHKLF